MTSHQLKQKMEVIKISKDTQVVLCQYLSKHDLFILKVAVNNDEITFLNTFIICHWIKNGYLNLLKKYDNLINYSAILCYNK